MTKKRNIRCVRPQKLLGANTTDKIYVGHVPVLGKKSKSFKMEDNFARYSIKSAVLESLRLDKKDFCFRKADEAEILDAISNSKLTVAWRRHYNSYGEYEYTTFLPVRYRKLEKGVYTPVTRVCYELEKIPRNIECKFIEDNKGRILKYALE